MATKKPPSDKCPGCDLPLAKDKKGFTCRGCGWNVIFSDDGDWFVACYGGKLDRVELERVREMVRLSSTNSTNSAN